MRNAKLLDSVPLGVFTWIVPVVAPAGTRAWMYVSETTVNVAAVPLNVTLVAPVRLFPSIVMDCPATPKLGLAQQSPNL